MTKRVLVYRGGEIMKHYYITFVDDNGSIHGVKVWARNEEEAIKRAVIRINEIMTGRMDYTFVDEDAVNVERLYKGE